MVPHRQPKCLLLPHSPVRVCWDLLGLVLIIMDAFMVPIALAWDVGIEPVDLGSTLMCLSFLTALTYWSSDVAMTLNTGFYSKGRLVLDRGQVFCHYLTTWLIFDLVLISLDVAAAVYQFALAGVPTEGLGGLEPQDILKSLRALRILRAFRLLRLLKMSRLSVVIEEASVAAGRQWLVLVVAIVNTTLTMVLCAHVLACGWYLLGRRLGSRHPWGFRGYPDPKGPISPRT
ncbi:unc-103 [Symbiodinium sp. KB8]|nr:unc-103 [Symbiodinium sp. KB8]